ncbi:TATA-binding protein-associated phosphoprotein [Entamoeba marina]
MNDDKPSRRRWRGEKIEKPLKDYELLQEVFLLYLLNPFCSVELTKPSHRSKTIPYIYKIIRITFEREEIEFNKTVENILTGIVEDEVVNGLPREKAKRHCESNRIGVTVNLLMDMCLEFGYFFTLKKSRKQIKTLKTDRIKEVYFNKVVYINEENVAYKSQQILAYIQKLFEIEHTIQLPRNCLLN